MQRRLVIATAVVVALAAAATAASAQTEPFSATYTEHFIPPHGNSRCPDNAFACGNGTATGHGALTTERTFDENCSCVFRTLTFADGTLTLNEGFVSFTGPGRSGSSNAPDPSEGHPGAYAFSWTVAGGTGSFAGATGSGTDDYDSAGLIATGALGGTITTP